MLCRICGMHGHVIYRDKCKQYLCTSCFIMTPKKISYNKFKLIYFNSADNIAKDVATVFYNDYLTSTYTIKEYIQQTTEKLDQ